MTFNAEDPPTITVIHSMPLFSAPRLDAPVVAIVNEGERGRLLSRSDGFLHIRCEEGPEGFVPGASCAPQAIAAPKGSHPPLSVVQPVLLYCVPAPGGQFLDVDRRIVYPGDSLLALGKDGRFLFVQCEDGQLGYVPAVLCGQAAALGEIIRIGPIDLGWIVLGFGWALPNLSGIEFVLRQAWLFDQFLRPFFFLGIVLAVMSALCLSPRRNAGRSFAIGLLLCYVLFHLISGGSATFWH